MSIPKDGYYIADVQLDTGGEHQLYVRVKGGKLHDEEGEELLPQACGDFNELSSVMIAWVWPEDVAMELEALRTANAGLMERVKRLEEASDTLIDAIQSVQCWNGTHVGDCIEQLESAKGQP